MLRGRSYSTFWKQEAPRLGFKLIDKNLGRGRDWERAMQTGREVMDQTIRRTGMHVGPDTTVVEIGCGIGRLAFALAEHAKEVVGVDVSPGYIEEARRNNPYEHVRFEVITGDGLSLPDVQSCDVVFSNGVFVFVDFDVVAAYARDAFRVLRPGGQFIFELESMPKTRLSAAARGVRRALHAAGVKEWRNWPTDPRFFRRVHDFEALVRTLLGAGYHIERVAEDPGHTWFVARKPALEAAPPASPPRAASEEPAAATADAS